MRNAFSWTMRDPTQPTPRDVGLAREFEALSNAVRLALLRELRRPRSLSAIRVAPDEDEPPLARQSVRRHLDRLLESGLVLETPAHPRSGTPEYVSNHQRLFALAEELLELAHLRPDLEPDVETAPRDDAARHPSLAGPTLVLVHGVGVGREFPLVGGPWRIGRHRDVEVALDFDPFVSGENALVTRAGDGHEVVDIAGSRNGTTHNLRPLPRGGRARLRHGDLVGVGRSLLLYRAT